MATVTFQPKYQNLSFDDIKNKPGIYKFTKPGPVTLDDIIRIVVLKLRNNEFLVLHYNENGLTVLDGDKEDVYQSNGFAFTPVQESLVIGE